MSVTNLSSITTSAADVLDHLHAVFGGGGVQTGRLERKACKAMNLIYHLAAHHLATIDVAYGASTERGGKDRQNCTPTIPQV